MITRRRMTAALCAMPFARALAAPAELGGFIRQLHVLEAGLPARMGVSILHTGSGRSWNYRAGERFPMCSTFKAIAAAAVLANVEAGTEKLARRVVFADRDLANYSPVTKTRVGGTGMPMAELCEAAVTHSDNTAANLMLRELGGPSAVTTFCRSRGDRVTRLDRWEPGLNSAVPGDPRDTTSPGAMTLLLNKILVNDGLRPESQVQLLAWLEANTTGDDRLRAGLPRHWRIGDKTGTGDHGTANDLAIVWPDAGKPWIASVFVTETAASLRDRNVAIAAIGQAVAMLVRS